MGQLVIFLILFVHFTESTFHFNNNACKTDSDYLTWFSNSNCYYNPDVDSDIPTVISRHNYKLEIHKVITDDNYILTIFRILPKNLQEAQPIFLQHGILTDSTTFINVGKKSLAFKLSDLGYDVWLGNLRATPFSSGHLNFTFQDSNYWRFNVDTLARYDIRRQLNYVAEKTGKGGSIIYLGHSLGSFLIHIYSSEYPEEAQRLLRGIVALSTPCYAKNVKIWTIVTPIFKLLKFFGVDKLFFPYKLFQMLFKNTCYLLPWLCRFFMMLTVGKTNQFPSDYLLLIYNSAPTTTSVDELLHYSQIWENDRSQRFDYGKSENLLKYGTIKPPAYDFGKIKLPVYLLFGENDVLASPENVNRVYEEIGSAEKYKIRIPSGNLTYAFNHLDFFYSKYIEEFLYKDLIPILVEGLPPKNEA